jgi:hypothetical protein
MIPFFLPMDQNVMINYEKLSVGLAGPAVPAVPAVIFFNSVIVSVTGSVNGTVLSRRCFL